MRKSSGTSGWCCDGGTPVNIIGSPSGPAAGSGVPTTILVARSSSEFGVSFNGSTGGSGAGGFESSKKLMLFSSRSAAREAIQKPAQLPLTGTEVRDDL